MYVSQIGSKLRVQIHNFSGKVLELAVHHYRRTYQTQETLPIITYLVVH